MFARIPSKLPKDPQFPTDLKKLGYFVDDNDEIKSIEYPEEHFQFWVSNSARYREVQREALHTWIRDEVTKRMTALGTPPFYIPQMSSTLPEHGSFCPIFMTPPAELVRKKRIIVVLGRGGEDLGVWSYRVLSKTGGINKGSSVGFAAEVLTRAKESQVEAPGIVILNPGQYLFSYKANKAMTLTSWDAMPRPSAVHPQATIHPIFNHIKGNEHTEDHLRFISENIFTNPEYVAPEAQIYFVAVQDGANEVIKALSQSPWDSQLSRIAALAFAAPTPIPKSSLEDEESPSEVILELLNKKSRSWTLSTHPVGEPLGNADAPASILAWQSQLREEAKSGDQSEDKEGDYGADVPNEIAVSPEVSGGASDYAECVMPAAYKDIVEWFGQVAAQDKNYANEELVISEEVLREREAGRIYVTPSSKGPWGKLDENDFDEG